MKYFGKYKAISKIGDGGMAYVYLVDDQEGNLFALKELKREHLKDRIKRKRFRIESHAIKKFNHKNIIKIIEPAHKIRVKSEQREYYSLVYLMKYYPKKSLKDLIRETTLSVEEINRIFSEVFEALDFCHSNKIYHRDLKPANILISENGKHLQPILTDFGVAKIRNKEFAKGENLTREVKLLGAPAYMSPEQIVDPSNVDDRSDLYSIGVILYEVLTGERPFKGSRNDLISQHMSSTPVPPSKLNPDVDSGIENLILQLLEKDAKNRPRLALEAKAQLEHVTTTITKGSRKIGNTNFLFKVNTLMHISQIYRGRRISNKVFTRFPVIIGKQSNYKRKNIFILEGDLRRIEKEHCEILLPSSMKIKLRDTSRVGTMVNGKKIINDVSALSLKRINRIGLPGKIKLEIFLKQEKAPNFIVILLIVMGIIFLLILITLLLL